MGRAPATFKQADLVRAVKAARTCGLKVLRTEITRDGTIVLFHNDDEKVGIDPTNAFDEWKAKRDARAAQGN